MCSARLTTFGSSAALGLAGDGVEVGPAGGADDRGDQALDQRRAALSRTAYLGGGPSSNASSALSTAEPRSIRTRTPSGEAAFVHRPPYLGGVGAERRPPHPAATATTGPSPCTISSASATAASARAGLCETTTIPIMSAPQRCERVGERREQQRRRGRHPGRGGRRCARRGSSRAPCGRRSGSVASRPAAAASAAAAGGGAEVRTRQPAPLERVERPAPARRTSSCRPASALPRATIPSSPARSAAEQRRTVEVGGVARGRAACAGRTCRTAGRSRRRPWSPASCRPS